MKKLAAVLGLAFALSANAECVMRTTSLTKVVGKLDAIADIVPIVSPEINGEVRCSVKLRVQYHGQWESAFGEYTGPLEVGTEELCVNAVEIAARQFLASKEAKLLHSDQQMVCSDDVPITVKSVAIGDNVKLSEVIINPQRSDFMYKGALCKWFTETTVNSKDLYLWNGVICRPDPRTDNWIVLDKF